MRKRSVFIYIFMLSCLLYSCKKEPVQSVPPETIMEKISESGIISPGLEILPVGDQKKFGQDDFLSLYGEENFDASSLSESVRGRYETEYTLGEVGIFKLLGEDQIEKYRSVFTGYISDMQKYYSGNGETEKAEIANNAEVRDYGNYVYYTICAEKDKVFNIIESSLREKQ